MIPIRPKSDIAPFSWASVTVALTGLSLAIWSLFAPEDKLEAGDLAVAFMFAGLAPGNVRFILLLFATYFLWGAGMALERHLNPTARWSLALGGVAVLGIGFAIWGIAPGAVVAGATLAALVLAMALYWGPGDELTCFSIGYRSFFGTPIVGSPFTFDLSVFGLLFFFVPFALFSLVFFRHGRTCIVGILSGFLGGMMIAHLALKAGWIDCRGWDLISIMTGKNLLMKGSRKSNRTSLAEPDRDSPVAGDQLTVAQSNSPRETLVRKFTAALSSRNSGATRDAYQKLRERFPVWEADGPELLQFAELLIDDGGPEEAVPLLTDYLARFQTSKVTIVRLKLAQILIDPLQRPRRALAILDDLPPGDLGNPKYNTHRDSLTNRANKLIDDGVMEVRLEG